MRQGAVAGRVNRCYSVGRVESLLERRATRRVTDSRAMALALTLAQRGRPAPNPHVGAVVVTGDASVGSGYHQRAGQPHAEVRALDSARGNTVGATLYVTLEPCNHRGRTPPCVDAILAAGVRRVVVGCRDPNPFVAGGGAAHLSASGVEVVFGPWEPAARELIRDWIERLDRP